MQPYRSLEWRKFREQMIRLHDGICAECGRGEGVVLQVHHKVYFKGRKPWEYSYLDCELLCRGCHGRLHGKVGVWECVGTDDLGDLSGNCDLCGTELRYLFLLENTVSGFMAVGEKCCDALTSTPDATEFMRKLQNKVARKKRFVSDQSWHVDRAGLPRKTYKKIRIAIRQDGDGFKLEMNGRRGRKPFRTIFDAQAFAFDVIESGAAKQYFEKFEL